MHKFTTLLRQKAWQTHDARSEASETKGLESNDRDPTWFEKSLVTFKNTLHNNEAKTSLENSQKFTDGHASGSWAPNRVPVQIQASTM